jgi:excisionase family DNA binding protein
LVLARENLRQKGKVQMLQTTVDVLKAAAKADPTLDAATRSRILAAMQAAAKPEGVPAAEGPCLLRRREVAKRLSVSVRTVDKLAAQGVLPKVHLPGRDRAAGFRESDVAALIAGKAE